MCVEVVTHEYSNNGLTCRICGSFTVDRKMQICLYLWTGRCGSGHICPYANADRCAVLAFVVQAQYIQCRPLCMQCKPNTCNAGPIHAMKAQYMQCRPNTCSAGPIHAMQAQYMKCRPQCRLNTCNAGPIHAIHAMQAQYMQYMQCRPNTCKAGPKHAMQARYMQCRPNT